jgi:prevent-host-death family protein
MPTVSIAEAKTHLAALVTRARAGEEIVIVDAGTPVARLVPIEPLRAPRVLGEYRDAIRIAPDAFNPMTADEVAEWEHGPISPDSKRPRVRRGPRTRAGVTDDESAPSRSRPPPPGRMPTA